MYAGRQTSRRLQVRGAGWDREGPGKERRAPGGKVLFRRSVTVEVIKWLHTLSSGGIETIALQRQVSQCGPGALGLPETHSGLQ